MLWEPTNVVRDMSPSLAPMPLHNLNVLHTIVPGLQGKKYVAESYSYAGVYTILTRVENNFKNNPFCLLHIYYRYSSFYI